MARQPVELNVDAHELKRVLAQAKAFDPKLHTQLRRDLQAAAQVAAKDVQAEVAKQPLYGSVKFSRGLRSGIAAGVKVKLVNGSTKVGVYITSSGTNPASKSLARKYDAPGGWRHPVFGGGSRRARFGAAITGSSRKKKIGGRRAVLVTQKGRPYFGTVITKHAPKIEESVRKALEDTTKIIASYK